MPNQRLTFILRLWTELDSSQTEAQVTLGGSLQAISAANQRLQILYFSSLEQIPELLRKFTSRSGSGLSQPLQREGNTGKEDKP